MGKIDFKSLLIGVLLMVCIFTLISSTQVNDNKNRYQVPAGGGADAFVIDTRTGAVVRIKTALVMKRNENAAYFTSEEIKEILARE